jgi:hypothetical protein
MRSSTNSYHALDDMHDRECEEDPEGQADAQRPPTDDPPPIPHAITL